MPENNFLPILDTWPDYFINPDEGLGTTYERFILQHLFQEIDINFKIDSVLETPAFGMTGISGINSLWWSKAGKKVTLTDTEPDRLNRIQKVWIQLGLPVQTVLCSERELPFAAGSYDLVWNFASLWFLNDLDYFAVQVKNIAGKIIFICVPNARGLGFRLRKYFTRLPADLHLENIRPQRIRRVFDGQGWKLHKQGIFDVPPWPDIPMKKEDLMQKLHLGFLLKLVNRQDSSTPAGRQSNILDYFAGKNNNLEKEILRYSWFENFPKPFRLLWGHHLFFIFKKVL